MTVWTAEAVRGDGDFPTEAAAAYETAWERCSAQAEHEVKHGIALLGFPTACCRVLGLACQPHPISQPLGGEIKGLQGSAEGCLGRAVLAQPVVVLCHPHRAAWHKPTLHAALTPVSFR